MSDQDLPIYYEAAIKSGAKPYWEILLEAVKEMDEIHAETEKKRAELKKLDERHRYLANL